MADDRHQIDLHFVPYSSNRKTAICCKCGTKCGVVLTGTSIPDIMTIYRKHIPKEDNG